MFTRSVFALLALTLALVAGSCTFVIPQAPAMPSPATPTAVPEEAEEGGEGAHEMADAHELSSPAGHTRTTLYVARLTGEQVVPAADTVASGTGAFVLDAGREISTLTYDLTFDGLGRGLPRRIALRNAGEGGIGDVVHVICGPPEATDCPQSTGDTVSGSWTSQDRQPLTPEMVREIASLRVYVEIETEEDEPGELRGQLETNGLMIAGQGFTSQLRGIPGVSSAAEASGTGAFFLVRFADGSELFTYQLSVTGLEGPLQGAQILAGGEGVSLSEDTPGLLSLSPTRVSEEQTGGTLAGAFEPGSLHLRPLSENMEELVAGNLAVVITTEANETGELLGLLTPIE